MRIREAQKHTDPEHCRKGHFATADLIPGADDTNDNGNIRIVVVVIVVVVSFVVVVFVLLVPSVGVAGLLRYRLLVLNPL
jgi:hypothetical protein